ncbi:MAG: hypothetical protein QF864_02045 [SAR202 cluster bacterium]|nr:hypothetical protein [SAR202 cluster bacterium]
MTNDWSKGASKILSDVMNDISKSERLAEHQLAKSNPKKYRLSTIMPNGLNYYWYHTLEKYNPNGKLLERHSWCRSKHKNSAGFFLIWYEVYKNKHTKRSNWKAEKTRKDAQDFCRRMETSKRVLKKSEIVENFNQIF